MKTELRQWLDIKKKVLRFSVDLFSEDNKRVVLYKGNRAVFFKTAAGAEEFRRLVRPYKFSEYRKLPWSFRRTHYTQANKIDREVFRANNT